MHSSRENPVIVLDGPAGAGKSSVAREVSRRLGLPFLDTGAIYRAITLVMLRKGIRPQIQTGFEALWKASKSHFRTRGFSSPVKT